MRPQVLFPLFVPVTSLKGIGPRMAPLYEKLCGRHVVDLLWHLPSGVIDRSYSPQLKYADRDRVATLTLKIVEHNPPRKPKLPYRIVGIDDTDQIVINYFNVKGDYLAKLYPTNEKVVVSGMLERYHANWSMSHPDYVLPPTRASEIPRFEPVYPLTEGIGGKMLRKTIEQALAKVPEMPEWNDPHLMQREKWPAFKTALFTAHNPRPETVPAQPPTQPPPQGGRSSAAFGGEGSAINSPPLEGGVRGGVETAARRRLAYDELLADQLALAVIRRHHRAGGGRAFPGTRQMQDKLTATLPFRLTPGQNEAISEISADMKAPRRMLRLLQGDVGSGKTVVALMAMLQAAESGSQAALMAPTEILAKQHHARLNEFLKPLGVEAGLLTGRGRGADRQTVLKGLEDGSLKLVVGTHALFQDEVKFHDLGLAVVDEQHRFGVNERLRLSDKGRGVDILVMTATPIPRTLTLTAYGDMDVSRLTDKPAGRSPIDTRIIDMARLDEVIDGVGRKIKDGAQVYWVCPLVEESELIDLAAATDRASLLAERLRNVFPKNQRHPREGGGPSSLVETGEAVQEMDARLRGHDVGSSGIVGLIHGRMRAEDKDRTMAAFAAGEIKVLVATTVIEVGVDVPNASLMLVEHAERFGLAQLHQLRGRVGRGAAKSDCLLLYKAPLGEVAKARLKMLRETQDGFVIAEEDLRLRGPGELLGLRQSGAPEFRLADLSIHRDLLAIAHDDAKLILHTDPELNSARGQALRVLLYLFERDAAVPLLRAG